MSDSMVLTEFITTFVRIMVYPLGALAVLNITVRRKRHHLGGFCIIVYFMFWCTALVVNLYSHQWYTAMVNYISTPLLVAIVILLWVQVWQMRHE